LELRQVLRLEVPTAKPAVKMHLPPRPPRLCPGCGHIDAYKVIRSAFLELGKKDYRVFGDIGCYTLGVEKPYESLHSTVEMGASVGMTLGAALSGMEPAVGVIGDSTFFHSGLPTLLSMVQCNVNANIVIMDNRITAMTGQQPTIVKDCLEKIAEGMGFDKERIHTFIPLPKFHKENVKKFKEIITHNGPDIIIFRRDCVQAVRKGLL
jgi:indolepyruvate ferredoxin oxidoreductase alpha subunit